MQFIWAIIVGFVVGAIAKIIMPGKDPGGFIITTLIGIGGALVATWIGRAAGWYGEQSGAGFVASIVGAILLLIIYRIIKQIVSPTNQGYNQRGPTVMPH